MENVVPDRGTERARWASKRQPPCDGGGGQRATVVVVGAATDWTARRFDVLLYKAPDPLRQGASHVRHQRLSGPPGRGQKRLSSLFLFPLALPFPVAVPRCHHQSSSGRAGMEIHIPVAAAHHPSVKLGHHRPCLRLVLQQVRVVVC